MDTGEEFPLTNTGRLTVSATASINMSGLLVQMDGFLDRNDTRFITWRNATIGMSSILGMTMIGDTVLIEDIMEDLIMVDHIIPVIPGTDLMGTIPIVILGFRPDCLYRVLISPCRSEIKRIDFRREGATI